MALAPRTIRAFHCALHTSLDPGSLIVSTAQDALDNANSNAGHNTYLWRNPAWTLSEAQKIATIPPSEATPLHGIPISVKDCFDLAGAATSCGTYFYRDLYGPANADSALVAQLRRAGAVITGKTHLHPLAYGITGENADFGDCLLPGDSKSLTGGSSSGAAASVLEGSAFAAIGTDTGGSIRVPAALCGIAGYRASHGRGDKSADWRGAAHLAPSFDTLGWLFPYLEDGPLLGSIFAPSKPLTASPPTRFAIIDDSFLHDCDPIVIASLRQCQAELQELGLSPHPLSIDWWHDSMEIFAPIQASEAAKIHAGHFAQFEPSIRQRLEWGASLNESELVTLRSRHAGFRARMDDLLAQHQLLLLPAAPVVRLAAGADHSQTRTRLLRYTTPISLSGMPAVTIPCFTSGAKAGGMQLIAAHNDDARLLTLTAQLGAQRNSADASSTAAW